MIYTEAEVIPDAAKNKFENQKNIYIKKYLNYYEKKNNNNNTNNHNNNLLKYQG